VLLPSLLLLLHVTAGRSCNNRLPLLLLALVLVPLLLQW
jgi:hypothetical protein